MQVNLPAGGSLAIASTYGPVVAMTAITNAVGAVATLAAGHGVVVGDTLEIVSSWEPLHQRVVRVSAVVTNAVTLEGVNTTNTTLFPVGLGAGSIRRITAWQPVTQVATIGMSGGEQQYADTNTIFSRISSQVPSNRTPVTAEISVHDHASLPFYSLIEAYAGLQVPAAMRIIGSGGARTFHNGFWSLSPFTTLEANQTVRRAISFASVSEPIHYAS